MKTNLIRPSAVFIFGPPLGRRSSCTGPEAIKGAEKGTACPFRSLDGLWPPQQYAQRSAESLTCGGLVWLASIAAGLGCRPTKEAEEEAEKKRKEAESKKSEAKKKRKLNQDLGISMTIWSAVTLTIIHLRTVRSAVR